MHAIYLILGVLAVALALGWRPSLASAKAFGLNLGGGLKALAVAPWWPAGAPKVTAAPATAGAAVADAAAIVKAPGFVATLGAYGLRLLLLIGVVLLVLSVSVGASAVAGVTSGLSPHDALDKSIRDFQSSVGLASDGVFGPATVKAYYGR